MSMQSGTHPSHNQNRAQHRPLTVKRIDAAVHAHRKQIETGQQATKKKLYDEKGLYLFLTSSGSASWRLKYRAAGRERLLSLGLYPEVSLREAREATDAARMKLRSGVDPAAERRKTRRAEALSATTTFRSVAQEWIEHKSNSWVPSTRQHIVSRLTRYAFPVLGAAPVAEITAPDVRDMVKRTEQHSLDTAHRVRGYTKSILQFAIACGLIEFNVAANVPASELPVKKHRPAITDP